jgi:hypothetical protein
MLISMSGFTKEAIADVRDNRNPAILLFNKAEITRLINGGTGPLPLIIRKRRALVDRGEVLFEESDSSWQKRIAPDSSKLPQPDIRFSRPASDPQHWIAGKGGFGHLVFSEDIPDIDWTVSQGSGAGFDIYPQLGRRDQIAHAFEVLQKLGWVTERGRFSLQQAHAYWYGAGAGSFLLALSRWEQRYSEVSAPLHHTEEATYFDVAEGGLYTLSFDVSADRQGDISGAQLSMQLPGIPLDPHPFTELVHAFDLVGDAHFRPLQPRPVYTLWRWPGPRTKLTRLSLIYDASDGWVSGIIASNPFKTALFDKQNTSPEVRERLSLLSEFDILPFRLRGWHEPEHAIDSYYLSGLEMTWTGDAAVLSLVSDWRMRATPNTAGRRLSTRRHSDAA